VTLELYRRELLKGSTETLILSLVSEVPMYGYQLVKEMEVRSSGYFHLKEGTLYPALHRLERDGLVEGTWEDSPTGAEPSVLSHHRRGRGEAPLDAARVGSFHPGRQPRGQACVGPGKGCV